MAKFFYKAKKGLNSIVEGTIEALNKEDAINKLFKEGLHPIAVNLAAGEGIKPAPEKKGVKKFILGFRRKITSGQILIFTQKLAILLKARVELLPALKVLYEQTQNPSFGDVILQIYNETREGRSFSNSLSLFPKVFSPLYVNIVKSGEAAGALDTALDQINEFLSRQEAMRTRVRVALAYPSLLLVVGLSSIFVLINFVVPRLKPIFVDLGERLPLVTKIVFKVSEVSNKSWAAILAVAAASLLIMLRLPACKSFLKEVARKIKVNLPVVKRMIKNQELAQFSRSLSLLLGRGVGALDALTIVTPTLIDPVLQKDFKKVCEMVASGKSLSSSIRDLTDLPDFFTKMIAVGEESGRLGEVLDEISHSYSQQIESDIALVSSLLEPVLILILGLVLGTIVLSILIPTFQITQIVS